MKNPLQISVKTEAIPVLLIIASFAASWFFYTRFPRSVPIHWNFEGQVDNWATPAFAAFTFPLLNLGIYVMFLFLPLIDPKKDRYKEFSKTYHIFKDAIVAFMTLIYFFVGLNGIGYDIPVKTYVPFFVGLLFILIGNYMGKLKRNWMIGLRTPWTLSSEEVWNKSNRFSGKIFMIGGVIMMTEAFIAVPYKLPVFIFCIALVVLAPIIYSFVLYAKTKK